MSDNGATAYPQVSLACHLCEESESVTWFCKSCPGSLCNKCADQHKTHSKYNVHSVVPRTYTVLRLYGPAKIAEQCRIHTDKEITTYCNRCRLPCCVSCLATNHQFHPFSPIEDMYLSTETMLNDYVMGLDKNVMPTLDEIGDHLMKDAASKNDLVQKAEKEVKDYRELLKHTVDQSCDSLLEKLHEHGSEYNVEDLRKEIHNRKQIVENIKREIIDKIKKGNLDLIEYSPPKYDLLISGMLFPVSGCPSFIPNTNVYHEISKNQIGEMTFSETVSLDIGRSRTVYKSSSFSSKIHVTSITGAGKNKAWVMHYGSNTMYLYNVSGRMVRAVTVKGSGDINGMSITHSGDMIFTNEDKKVRRVSERREISILIDTAPFNCYGACLNDKEEIVVCMSDQGERNHVAVHSSDGCSKVCAIQGRDAQGKQLITDPYRVVQNGGDLCVLNISKNVVCVNKKGDVRWVYDGEQAQLERSFYPLGLCVDKYHNVLITDNNNDCIHYIDKEGGLIKLILTHEQTALRKPWGICVDDETGQVWVGNSNKEITIVKYTT